MKKLVLLIFLLLLNSSANETDRGITLLKNGDYENAKKTLLEEARKLNSKANYILGYMFYYGEGEFITPKVGLEFFKFANKISSRKGVIDFECDWRVVMSEPHRCRDFIKEKILNK